MMAPVEDVAVYHNSAGALFSSWENNSFHEIHQEAVEALVADYLHRFSQIAGPLINCAPILNWFELDNRGNRLLVADDSDINTPAVAAALVGKRYVAQASDEISLEVGDMISVIDMAPPDESVWWRGKRGFEVGFFPCECVQLIGEKVPQQLAFAMRPRRSATLQQPSRPVLRKHGKLIAFFRSFIQTRPSRRKLKQSGILKERVFGCDLGEHLMNTGRDIPVVLRSCAEFIEAHGIVDGIYRLSGVNSNIQRLRNTFDEDRVPDLADPSVRQDIHSVSCLLKQYLRELPNPLLTYQLYDKFVAAVQSSDDQRLLRMRDVVQQLPPPHYRTLEYLIRHLARVSTHGHNTGMTPKNLAIVWAPNLVRSKELEVGGVAALQGVGIQAVVVEYLIRYCELIFSDKLPAFCPDVPPQTRTPKRSRPKSLAISTPTKLLSLEEARSRALGVSAKADQKYIEVGGGPSTLPTKYHTVIELPQRKSGSLKFRRSPIGWKSLFRGRPTKPHQRKGSEPIDIGLTDKTLTESDLTQSRVRTRRLRSVKSADSLVSMCHAESKRSSMLMDSSPSPATLPASAPAAESLAMRSCSESDTPETDPAVRAHARSVSHDSYFNNLLELKLPFCDADRLEEEDEELQTQYCFDDSDMRVFSEDETMRATDSTGWRGRIRQLTSPPRVRRATRSEEGGVKRTATGSFRDKVLSALSPGARRRAEEAAAEAGGSPRVKVRKKASVETLTCSESTSVDVSSLRTDGSLPAALSTEGEVTLSPPPAAAAPAGAAPVLGAVVPAGRQVVAEVHVSPEPSTCQDIILLSPISECTASSAEHYGRPSASSPGEDVTEHDVSEIADSDGGLTPAADANRISTLVPEALELLDRRLNSESFRRAVADAAAGAGGEGDVDVEADEGVDVAQDAGAYENIAPAEVRGEVTPIAEDADASYEPVVFSSIAAASAAADISSSDVGVYENAAFASAAETWEPLSGAAPTDADGDELVYENVSPPPPDAVYQQVRVFRNSLQEVNALVGGAGGADGRVVPESALLSARRSFVEPAAAPAAGGSSPTRSCPVFSDGSPSPTDVRYSQLSSTVSSPERRLGSADITTAATCSDTLDERPLPSEAEPAEFVELGPTEAAETVEKVEEVETGELVEPEERPSAPQPSPGRIEGTQVEGGESEGEDERLDTGVAVTAELDDGWGATPLGSASDVVVTPPPPLEGMCPPGSVHGGDPAPDELAPAAVTVDALEEVPAVAPAAAPVVSPAESPDLPLLSPAPEQLPVSASEPADLEAVLDPASCEEQLAGAEFPAADVCDDPVTAREEESCVREADTALRLLGADAAEETPLEGGDLLAGATTDLLDDDSVTSPEDFVPRVSVVEEPMQVFAGDFTPAPEDLTVQGTFTATGDSAFPDVASTPKDLLHQGFPAPQENLLSSDREQTEEDLLSPSPLPPPDETMLPDASDAVAAGLPTPDHDQHADLSSESGPDSPPPAGPLSPLSPLRPAGDSGLGTPEDGFAGATRNSASPSPPASEPSPLDSVSQEAGPAERPVEPPPAAAAAAEEVAAERPMEVMDDAAAELPPTDGTRGLIDGEGTTEAPALHQHTDAKHSAGGVDRVASAAPESCCVTQEPTPVTLTAEEAAVTRPRASSQSVTAAREASAPVSIPGRETERRAGGARAAASWPSPGDSCGGGGGGRPAEPAPAWLRSDLRRLSDRRASVKQLLSKFEVKEEEDEEGDVFVGEAGSLPAAAAAPVKATELELERVSRKTSLPERPRYLFSPKPFQRQLSDQTAARSRPEPGRGSPLVSPDTAPVNITENPLHAATERLARVAAETARSPVDAPRANGVRELSPALATTPAAAPAAAERPSSLGGLRVGSVPSQELRVGCVPSRAANAEPARSSPAAAEHAPETSAPPGVPTASTPPSTPSNAPSNAPSNVQKEGEAQDGQQAHTGVVEGRLVIELDVTARERIERYKQERRSLLREKFKTESFKREKNEVLQDLRRPDAGRREEEGSKSPSPTRREPLRRSDSEAASAVERRAARPAVVSAPPAVAPFRRAASLRSPSQESAPPLTAAPAPAVSPSANVNDRLAAARERVSQLKSQELAAVLAQSTAPASAPAPTPAPTSASAPAPAPTPAPASAPASTRSSMTTRDPTEDVNVREQVAGWSRGQRPAGAGRRTPAATTPTTPTRVGMRSQLPDPGKIRNIAAKFEETAEGARKSNYVSTV